MTTNSTWAALRNPAFRKLWIAAVISGTCVAAHDSAATWTMNIFTGSPLLLSLMSTVASLPFFLFTLPAGALADKVDRQNLANFSHPFGVKKEVVGTRALLTRSLFACDILHRLLPHVSLAKPTSAGVRF
jgi:MFS family permease